MSVEIRDRRFAEVVGAEVAYETLADGYLFTEGPLWDPRQHRLLFSDIPGNLIAQWSRAGGASVFRAPSNMSNGLALDREGRLLCCEHATSRLTRTEADGAITVLASAYEGKELNSPNDVVVKSDGGIYFTDPTYGRMEYYGVPRAPQLGFRGVYRVEPDGRTPHAARGRLRAAERPVLLRRRAPALRQRHRARAHPGVRRARRRHAGERPGLGRGLGRGSRARPTA